MRGLHTGCWICLIKPEYVLCINMREYALVTEYDWICKHLKKQSAEYARILNVSDTAYSIGSLYTLLSSYRDRRIQNVSGGAFCKKIMCECRHATKNLSGQGRRGVFVELGHFDRHLEKDSPQGNILEFFPLDILKTTSEWKIWSKNGHSQGLSFQNLDTFFNFQKDVSSHP